MGDALNVKKLNRITLKNDIVVPVCSISEFVIDEVVNGMYQQKVTAEDSNGRTYFSLDVESSTPDQKLSILKALFGVAQQCHDSKLDASKVIEAISGNANEYTQIVEYAKNFENFGWHFHGLDISRRIFNNSDTGIEANRQMRINGFGGLNFAQARKQIELDAEWPVFEGLESLWGFKFEVTEEVRKQVAFVALHREDIESFKEHKETYLKDYPALIADKLEEAILDPSYDVETWLNAHADSFLGKGKSLPVLMEKLSSGTTQKATYSVKV